MKPITEITGHLSITKKFIDDRPDEVVIDQENLITIGLSTFLADIMTGEFSDSATLGDFGLNWLQLGASAQNNYSTNYFYELSSPFSLEDYGEHTSLVFEKHLQVIAEDPFYVPPTFSTAERTFFKIPESNMVKITDSEILYTVLIDENTLNGKNISEAGLFYNDIMAEGVTKLHLGAYKAFGLKDGLGNAVSIAKTNEFKIQIEWVLAANTGDVVEVETFESGDNFNFYKAAKTNPNGNALVCYFPHIAKDQEPYNKYTTILDEKQHNIELNLFQRLLSNGFSIASFNYRFPTSATPSASPVFASSVGVYNGHDADASTALLPSSTNPLRLPNELENCFTDAVSSVQWAKEYGATSWGINPSNVFTVGNGIGGTLAGFVAYAPEFSGASNNTFEVCSSRVLGTSLKDSVTDWYRWYPYTLSTFDFKLALIPRQINMYGSVQSDAGLLETSSTSHYDNGFWITSSLSGMSGTVSSYIFDDSDFSSSGFHWSAIPTLKELYQWKETPDVSKRFWSPTHQASSLTSSILDARYPGAVWGHHKNGEVYSHLSYAGSSTSGTNIVDLSPSTVSGTNFKLLDYSTNSYIHMGNVKEPVINLDYFTNYNNIPYVVNTSSNVSGMDPHQAFFRSASALGNDIRDELQGKQLWEVLQAFHDHGTSSVFTNYDSLAQINPGSKYRTGNTSVYNIWNLNMESQCARDRVNWLVDIVKFYDSWYDQFD